MDKFEFGDFYRFCVSLGLAMMLLALLIPWMLVKETSWVDAPFPVSSPRHSPHKVGSARLSRAPTPPELDRKAAAAERARIVRFAYEWVGWPTGLFALGGLFFFSYGVWNWRARQVKRDEKENAEIDQILDSVAPKATPESVELQTELDAAQNEQSPADQHDMPAAAAEPGGVRSSGAAALKGRAIEDRVLSLIEADVAGFSVRRERQLGRTVADAIMVAVGNQQMDVVVEVKWIRRGFRTGWFIEVMQRVSAMVDLYAAKSNRTARGLLIIVVSDSVFPAIQHLFTDSVLQGALRGPLSAIGVSILNESAVVRGTFRGREIVDRREGVWLHYSEKPA